MKKKLNKKIGVAAATAGVIAGAVAAGVAIYRRNKNEEVYHEEELRAMNELDDMNAESTEDAAEECANMDCDIRENIPEEETAQAAADADDEECDDAVCDAPEEDEAAEEPADAPAEDAEPDEAAPAETEEAAAPADEEA